MSRNPAVCDDGWDKLRQAAQGTIRAAVDNDIAGESSGTERNLRGYQQLLGLLAEEMRIWNTAVRRRLMEYYTVTGCIGSRRRCGAKALIGEAADIPGEEEPLGRTGKVTATAEGEAGMKNCNS